MALPTHSQTTSIGQKNRVTTTIDSNGDTLVTMSYEDARILLRDVLYYEYTDSLLTEYKKRDSLNSDIITMEKSVISKLTQENINLEQIISNLEQVIINKDIEISLKDEIIKKQKKEIRKQKILKVIGFSGAVILPIVTLIAIL